MLVRAITFALLACNLACGSGDKPQNRTEQRRAALEAVLDDLPLGDAGVIDRQVLETAAREYRALMGDSAEALHVIAKAWRRVGDETAELEIWRTLIQRGHATREDRFHAIRIILSLRLKGDASYFDDATYRANLVWLRRELENDRECKHHLLLAVWTLGRNEELAAIDQALRMCRDEIDRLVLHERRHVLLGRPEDACDAIVNGSGDRELGHRCLKAPSSWKTQFARVVVQHASPETLRSIVNEPGITSHVLEFFALWTVSDTDACAALDRAKEIQLGWDDNEPDPAMVDSRLDAAKRVRSCRR